MRGSSSQLLTDISVITVHATKLLLVTYVNPNYESIRMIYLLK